jgi:tetratricopeptide (TPR) repeat protein
MNSHGRLSLLAGLWLTFFVSSVSALRAQQTITVPAASVDRVERWLKAVARHDPGGEDAASDEIAAWSNGALQTLWVDLSSLVALMRRPDLNKFTVTPQGSSKGTRIDYPPLQLQRMRVYACAAAGALKELPCVNLRAADSVDAQLRVLAARAEASRSGGDPNYTIRRAAIMHADIAMAGPLPTAPVDKRRTPAPQSFLLRMTDGQMEEFGQTAIHWEIGRMLLDDVRPAGAQNPRPSADSMVRQWYHATSAWMQKKEHLDLTHLKRARAIFPRDADILFLTGCIHETYAGAQIQSVARSVVLPHDVVMDMQAEHAELKMAEDALREAVDMRPESPEARLRFGRVIALRGRYAEAVPEIRRALESMPPEEHALRYYGELFLGGAEEGAGRFDESRRAFERAAALFPKAQSPLLGLSELSRRQGDRRGALDAMQKVFELPPLEDERVDPWWGYHVFQARNTDQLLDQLWKPFRAQQEVQR